MRWKEWAVELYERCREADHQYPGLALDLIELHPNRQMSDRELKTIVQKHAGQPPDVEFEFVEDLPAIPGVRLVLDHGRSTGSNWGGVTRTWW